MITIKNYLSTICLFLVKFLFFYTFFSCFVFGEYRHPVKNVRITSLFGESRLDHFHNGIDYSNKQPILAIEKGKVIYIRDPSKNPLSLKMGTGGTVVVEHPDKIRSYYLHIEEDSSTKKLEVKKGEEIAMMGNTGSSYGNHLHLIVESTKEKRIYNPLNIVPKVPDNNPPYLVSILGKIKEKIYRIRNNASFRYFGPMAIIAISWDNRPGLPRQRNPMNVSAVNPYHLELWIDGKLRKIVSFKHLDYSENVMKLASGQTFSEVYGFNFNYHLDTFSPNKSKHLLRVVTRDKNKNYSEISYRIFFR